MTKPSRPNSFKYNREDDPALLLELVEKNIALATVRGRLRDSDEQIYERRYWPAEAVAVATGRQTQVIRLWHRERKFIPAQKLSGRWAYSEEDVAKLLRTGDFFQQSVHDTGHVGELAARADEARGRPLDEQGRAYPRDEEGNHPFDGNANGPGAGLPGLPGSSRNRRV